MNHIIETICASGRRVNSAPRKSFSAKFTIIWKRIFSELTSVKAFNHDLALFLSNNLSKILILK